LGKPTRAALQAVLRAPLSYAAAVVAIGSSPWNARQSMHSCLRICEILPGEILNLFAALPVLSCHGAR
jgi:hypothetical protein